MKRFLNRWGPPLLWAAAIFTLSSFSSLPHLPKLLSWDKLQHAAAYGVGAALVARSAWPGRRWAVIAVGLISFYGVTDEIHQSFVPGRSCDVFDWVADTTGALAAVGLIHLLTSRRARGGTFPVRAAEPIAE